MEPARDVTLPHSDAKLVADVDLALAALRGKWKVELIFLLARGVHRHGRLLESLDGVSKKMLTDALRSLERDGLVERNVRQDAARRVEYSLTPCGWSLTDPLMALAEWGEAHADEIELARARHSDADAA